MKDRKHNRIITTKLPAVTVLICLLAAVYLFVVRPAQLHWGATAGEAARPMPGDDLVPAPTFCATRAITIRGTPKEVWPWLVQMGYRRAGYYGYDLIENLGSETGIRSADSILPELQHPRTGDVLPISTAASAFFGPMQQDSYLIWQGKTTAPSDGSFVWALYPIDNGHTRLISRVRLHYHWTEPRLLLLDIFTEFGDHVAVPKILLGIQARVERRSLQSLGSEAIEIAVWVLALFEFAAALVLLFCWPRWGSAWALGLATGLSLLFVLYARVPVWIGAALSACILAGMFLISSLSPLRGGEEE
jgi:hypothetical protein